MIEIIVGATFIALTVVVMAVSISRFRKVENGYREKMDELQSLKAEMEETIPGIIRTNSRMGMEIENLKARVPILRYLCEEDANRLYREAEILLNEKLKGDGDYDLKNGKTK